MGKVELLAPAGNYESFLGAIHAGADAVYLGGSKFGARAFADNFTEEELCKAIKYAHLFGRKVYLTLNTLIKEREFGELYSYLSPFYEAGLDGVIVQDLGVFSFVRKYFPDLPLHVSTQMTVTGVFGAEFLKKEGAVRIVPARELSLAEIREIKEKTGLEMETFIHGAMCYCYSGQCLFSSLLGGRSGNRGKCAQPCRLPYEVLKEGNSLKGVGTEYPLSLKDMCMIMHIPDLIEAGIDSFKIEGRMKKAEYAAGVTAIYRKYIDLYYEKGREGFVVAEEDMERLESLYIRSEIQDGYYYRHNGKGMITEKAPGYSGSDERLLNQIRAKYLEQRLKLPVKMQAYFCKGQDAVLTVSCNDTYVSVTGMVVQTAMKQPVTKENIFDGLCALGETVFQLTELDIQCDDNIFYPLKAIKELRREAISQLEQEIVQEQFRMREKKMASVFVYEKTDRRETDRTQDGKLHVSVMQKKQMEAVLQTKVSMGRIYLDADMCRNSTEWEEVLSLFKQPDIRKCVDEVYITLPYIIRKRDEKFLEKVYPLLERADGCMVRTLEGYGYLQKKGYPKKICGDAGFYQWNCESRDFWAENGVTSFCVPYELNAREQQEVTNEGEWENVVYGRIPMMITANCIANTTTGCLLINEKMDETGRKYLYSLKDRYHTAFPVYTNCNHCYNVIYNSVPLSLHDKVMKEKTKDTIRLDFTVESKRETDEILRFFHGLSEGKEMRRPYEQFTTGHEKRGTL